MLSPGSNGSCFHSKNLYHIKCESKIVPFCPKCGRYTEEEPGVKFCPYCGASLYFRHEPEKEVKNAGETDSEKIIELRVAEPKWWDISSRVARVDSKSLAELNLSPGEVIKITGKRSTVAIVQPSYKEDDGKGLIRIDYEARKNAGVSIGDYVKISKVAAKQATKIVLAPYNELPFVGDLSRIVKNQLMNRPVMKNDIVIVSILGMSIELRVVSTNPDNVVIITKDTDVEVVTHPLRIPLEEGWPVYYRGGHPMFPPETDPVIFKVSDDQIEILKKDYSQLFAIKYHDIIDVRAEVRQESSPANVIVSTALSTLILGPPAGLLLGPIVGVMAKDAHYFLVIEFSDELGKHRKAEFEGTKDTIDSIARLIYKKTIRKTSDSK